MNDPEFHQFMADLYAQQSRPTQVNTEDWKNRTRISAKLPFDLYASLMAYCRKHGYSINSATIEIFRSYFESNA